MTKARQSKLARKLFSSSLEGRKILGAIRKDNKMIYGEKKVEYNNYSAINVGGEYDLFPKKL